MTALYDFSPLLRLLLVGAALAAVPLWLALRQRHASPVGRLRALTLVILFLTFDLVLFGAFTRLTDSGLGCPDWPGCYGHASPLGAHGDIALAQSAMPTGPVTHGKAWVEMVHRYWASGVGALIVVLAAMVWRLRWREPSVRTPSPWWATATLVWVCVQGAFGAWTVTMKLFPAIVTMHLLGGYILLMLLTVQAARLHLLQCDSTPIALDMKVKAWIAFALALLLLQAASGAWVSTNYAVLACTEFPKCQGAWWPTMNFDQAFELWRPLGFTQAGDTLVFEALTAIHVAHRLLALVTVLTLASLAAYLLRYSKLTWPSRILLGLLALQVLTGVSNAVLDWPLIAAVLHTGGAGAMAVVLVWLLAITQGHSAAERADAFSRRLTE